MVQKADNLVEECYNFIWYSNDDDRRDCAKELAIEMVQRQIDLYNELNLLGHLKPNSIGFELINLKQQIENL